MSLYSPSEDKLIPVLTVDTAGRERVRFPSTGPFSEPSRLERQVIKEGPELINGTSDSAASLKLVPFGNFSRRAASLLPGRQTLFDFALNRDCLMIPAG